jgi:hypothetical protein
MPPYSADRNLLFGIIALQMDFISRDQLIAAMHAWLLDKATSLGQILENQGALTAVRRSLLDTLVDEHVKLHDGDLHKSLAALVAIDSAREELSRIADPDITASLVQVRAATMAPDGDPFRTTTALPAVERRSRYALTRLHGQGGLGRVWLARDEELRREVALKEIQPAKAEQAELRLRFLKEAQVASQLEHPNIPPVYDLARGPEDDRPFYTMRFVRGGTMQQAIADYHRDRREGKADPLAASNLLHAFLGVGQAVAYAHSRGVIHRDLKPQNVVLGDFGAVSLLDWGLAKTIDRDDGLDGMPAVSVGGDAGAAQTRAGQLLGTPAYMSPEQANGRLELIDARTDVYGLGAILFEILTGRPPHNCQDSEGLLRRIIEGETPRVRALDARISRALDAICAKAMAKNPAKRYASAGELLDDVKRWLSDEPVSAWREPTSARSRRWARRHGAAVVATSIFIVVAALTAVVNLVWYARTIEEQVTFMAEAEVDVLASEVRDYFDRAVDLAKVIADHQEPLGHRADPDTIHFLRMVLDATPKRQAEGAYIAFERKHYRQPDAVQSHRRKGAAHAKQVKYDFHNANDEKCEWYWGAKHMRDGDCNISKPYFDKGGADISMVSVTCPIYDSSGEFVGVAGVDLDMQELINFVQQRLVGRQGGGRPRGYAYLVSHDRCVFAHPDQDPIKSPYLDLSTFPEGPSVKAKPENVGRHVSLPSGERRRISWTSATIPDWKVVHNVPEAQVVAPIQNIALISLAIAVLVVCVVSLTRRAFRQAGSRAEPRR